MKIVRAGARSRRDFLRLAAGAGGLVALGCGGEQLQPAPLVAIDSTPSTASPTSVPAEPSPTATPDPPPPAGREVRTLLPGTPYETALYITHSGHRGVTVMVLGGVHGNEPGGWLAADAIAAWEPNAGSLLVIPRANVLALESFVRTTEALGDLNRLYPGNPGGLPMERMAHDIVELAREFGVSLLLDLHESWGFWIDRPQSGTAYLGQTLTTGVGPLAPHFGQQVVDAVNPSIGDGRDRLLVRDGATFRRMDNPATGGPTATRGRSSLALGGHVEGLTPVLVEMGQQDQPLERRVELHLAVARAALELVGVL
jgi:hypothetical protein